MNITGYTSGFQREKAVDAYKNSLSIRSRLNDIYENANAETSRNKKYNITPVIQSKTAEEDIKDSSFQLEKAMTNLKRMLKINDAGTVLDKLRAGDEVVVFNRFFNLFEKDVGNQSNLTPTAFYQLWERYKEKLLASGTTGIFIPSQKADIDTLVGRIDTLITSSGLTDAEVKKVSGMVEFLYESGMNKQIEAIYKMLNTKKEYERLVRETKLEREDIAREKKKWKSDVDGVLSGIIEAENEAKVAKEPNRFAALANYEEVVQSMGVHQDDLFVIDEKIARLTEDYDNGDIGFEAFQHNLAILENQRKELKVEAPKEKKKNKKKELVENIVFSSKVEPPKPTVEKRIAQKERAKETKLRKEEEQKEESAFKKKKETEKQRKAKENELSQEALIEQFYEESGTKAKIEKAKKEKKLAKTMKGLKAQSYADIEEARLSRIATNKFKNVIDEINQIVRMGGTDLLSYKEAQDIINNSPSHSRRSSEKFEGNVLAFLDNLLVDVQSQLIGAESKEDVKQVEEVVNDATSDLIARQMEEELAAFAVSAQYAIGETKDEGEKAKIESNLNDSANKVVSYYTALMRQVEQDGQKKVMAFTSSSKGVFEGAFNYKKTEALTDELEKLPDKELLNTAKEILAKTQKFDNPAFGYKTKQQTFSAKTRKRDKLISYIVYHVTGLVYIPPAGKGLSKKIYKGKGVETSKNKYYEFGNYLIHVPQLEKGFLSLRYPSEGPIKEFPKTIISSGFSTLLYEIIDTKKFNVREYEMLDDDEKELFDRLIMFAKISRNDIDNMSKHRKITDKQRDADVKRFNILKGEIVAGNDNPNVIKEVKVLLIKLHNEKVIGKADFNRIMQNLVYLS